VSEERRTIWRWLVALSAALLLGGGAWAAAQFSPGFRSSWPVWKAHGAERLQEMLLWLQFFGSLLFSVLALLWLTALLFALLLALVYLLSRFLGWLSARPRTSTGLRRACGFALDLLGRERWVGTVLNLAASAGALGAFVWLSGLPLDYWDLGIQGIVAGVVELIVMGVLFREGKVGWFARS
jgi:hypothetical protein